MNKRIGVDLMGSESSPHNLFRAVLEAQQQLKETTLVVFCTQSVLEALPKSHSIEFNVSDEVIEMDDSPLLAVRRKKNSTMLMGLKALAAKQIDAFVSAGNTGALVVGSRLNLNLLPLVERPGLLALLPTKKGLMSVIDVGGNVDCKATDLVQFARMAVAYQACMFNNKNPRIALLNIGIESRKGTSEVQQAYQLLKSEYSGSGPHFVGNLEGMEIFDGQTDILVTDGFSGNVFLKTSEGMAHFILEMLNAEKSVLNKIENVVNYDEYPGAVLCGVDGLVIKCHGYSSGKAFLNGIKGASVLIRNSLIKKLS